MIEKKEFFKVEMVTPKDGTATRSYNQSIEKFGRLGREIKISPKSSIAINTAGFTTEFFVDTVSVLIGIGKDYTADLIMTKEAWYALNNGEKINIDTDKEFKKKFL